MAQAVKTTKRVPHTTYVDEEVITLTLDRREAEALLTVCAFVGGEPDGPRGIFSERKSSLMSVLTKALGVRYDQTELHSQVEQRSGRGVYFKRNSDD